MGGDSRGHVAVLVNPAARRGAGAEHARSVIARLTERGAAVRTYEGDGPGETARLAGQAVAAGPDVLAVVGGDGTVAGTLPHLVDTGTPLAVVGGGTGNDLARMHGIPADPRDAADVVLDGERRAVDTGTITADDGTVTRFVTIACAGFDSRANERVNRLRWPRGAARYRVGMYLEVLGLRTFRYTLAADGAAPVTVPGHLVAIGNTRYYGSGRPILPEADAADGLLDVTLVEAVGRFGLIGLDRPIARGEHLGRRGVRSLRASSIRVAADGDLVMYADGERVGSLPVTVTAHRRNLTLCVPGVRPEPMTRSRTGSGARGRP